MTTLSDSFTVAHTPRIGRGRVYAVPLFIAMVIGLVVSFLGVVNTVTVNFQSPVFTENSVSYPVINAATYNTYLISSIFFIGLIAVSVLLLGYEAEVFGLALVVLMVGFGVFAGIVYASSERQDVLPYGAELQVLNSHFDEPFETVIVNAHSDKMYVGSDGVSYKFRKSVIDDKSTWTLEKVNK
jgi:hypothetical protein